MHRKRKPPARARPLEARDAEHFLYGMIAGVLLSIIVGILLFYPHYVTTRTPFP